MRLADNRRTTARVVLFIVVSVMTTLVLFSGGPIGAISFAQQQTTSGTSIKWVNPDESTSNEISAKDDDPGAPTDTAYHLVTWVSTLPSNYSVTYQYQGADDSAPTTIGNATLVGSDTFELFWPSSAMPGDGTYDLIAILSSNGSEVARDTEEVVVNNESSADPVSDPREDQGETVEIIDPTNADGLGFYDAPGGDTVYAASLVVRHSADVEDITPYYSTSAPGAEPEFVECDNGAESADDAGDGVRCELVAPTTPTQVTAVAVVASDNPIPGPAPADIDSADAHRVTGYVSDPTSVFISDTSVEATAGNCTPAITGTLLDQNGSRVPGANVDVHAQGPDDSLAFDAYDADADNNSTSASKAPENHATETARDCETEPEGAAGEQGWHESGSQDRVHIETLEGTEDDGDFTFRLYSANNGTTQFTIWADEDGNDRFCTQEAAGHGSVGWGQAPPAATGTGGEDTSCPSSTGTTNTTTPPASNSPSPTPTQSNTSSPSPSPSDTETPKPTDQVPSSVSITYDDNGKPNRFKGSVATSKRKCARNRDVVILKVKKGPDKKVGSDKSSRGGNYRVTLNNARGKYYAKVLQKKVPTKQAILNCQKDKSPRIRVR